MTTFPIRAYQHARRRVAELPLLWRAYRILRRYSTHYEAARRFYRASVSPVAQPIGPSAIGVCVLGEPGAPRVALPDDFDARVATVADSAARALDDESRCDYFPPVAPGRAPAEAMQSGDVISIALRDPLELDGMSTLAAALVPPIEQTIYGSYVIVDKVYVYRSPVSRQTPRQSWLWHFDNHPREMLKVMVYLTDVAEGTAPFEFIRDRTTGLARLGAPLLPKFGDSRVAAATVERWISEDAERAVVTGRRGTVVIFDDNVVHRATLAAERHRDVVVFQLRPAAFKPAAPIDRHWTGSFPHHDYHFDPWLLAPKPR